MGEIADDYRRLLFVRLHTDAGLTGPGETYPRPAVAPELLGTEPSPERVWRDVFRHANYWGVTAGRRCARSGISGRRPRTYNTCYGGKYSFLEEPGALAESLLAEGISAMKIWPYDDIAYANGGSHVPPVELRAGAEPLRAIREALGHEIDIAMEFHGLWDLQSAERIARYLEQYDPMWLEEMLEGGNVDVEWTGGLTEARKVAAMAEANQVPVAPHNCGGPVLHFANLHLGATVPNLMVMESVRDRYDGWHRDLITTPAGAEDRELVVPDGPGLGTELSEGVLEVEVSPAASPAPEPVPEQSFCPSLQWVGHEGDRRRDVHAPRPHRRDGR